MRESLSRLLEAQPEILLTRLGSGVAPRVVLLDAQSANVFRRCSELVHGVSPLLVLLVGADSDEEFAIEALRAGARGILLRSAGLDELFKAIRVVAEGQVWADQRIVARALALLSSLSAPAGRPADGPEGRLTAREREIFRHAMGGLSNREIADRMAISPATVKAHLTSVFRKLEVRDRTQLVVHYQRSARSAQASSAPFSLHPGRNSDYDPGRTPLRSKVVGADRDARPID